VPDEQNEDGTPYREDEGKEPTEQPDPTAGLKSALQKEREARKAAEKAVKSVESRLLEMEQTVKAKESGITSERLDEIRTLAEAKFKADLEERDRLRAENRTLKLDNSVKKVLEKAEVVSVEGAWKMFHDEFDLTDDGRPIVKADPTADVEHYVTQTLRAQHPYLFRGTQAGGGGAMGGRGTAPVRSIASGDVQSFLANLDDIASGKVEVR
jgi:hypothetical protein